MLASVAIEVKVVYLAFAQIFPPIIRGDNMLKALTVRTCYEMLEHSKMVSLARARGVAKKKSFALHK
jgi:hypothetical protein